MTAIKGDLDSWAVEPRGERRVLRVDLYSALGVTLVAALAYLVAIFTQAQPPEGFAVSLVTVAPLSGALALVILWFCGRAFDDPLLRWYAVGLAVAVPAMALQLISFPLVAADGGPLGTGRDSSATLYLLFHLVPAACTFAGVRRASTGAGRVVVVVGVAVGVLVAADVVPLPSLIDVDGSFTTTLLVLEGVCALVVLAAAVVWTRSVGRTPSAPHAWIGVSLMLNFADLLFNVLGGARFTPVWWASLSMRAATYAVLLVGCLVWLLLSLSNAERYTERELSRREGQLGVAFGLTRRLLGVSERLSLAVSLRDVTDAVVDLARDGTSMTAGRLHVPGADTPPPSPAFASMMAAHRRGNGVVLASGREDLARLLPGAEVPDEVRAVALVPIALGAREVAHLALWSHHDHRWSHEDAQFLAGLADQAGQALQRAAAYESMATAATTLQESLLPARLPALDGLHLLSAYRPLTEHTQVGGDWYDCVEIDHRRVALVIGDVMGKGLRAAAVMGQVRVAMRTAIGFDPSPTAVLRALDTGVLDLEDDEIITLTYAVLDLETGLLGVARAGHPPVLIARPEAGVETLEDGGSPPIGVPVGTRAEVWTQLEPGSALVLYTDGLVESRHASLDVGIDETARQVERVHAEAATRHAAWAAWLAEIQARSGWQDDVAVLIALYR
ncbi:SpoIIE family protein phosphatase [Nocardioides sp. HDW12B]|uniref:PP2C family protein-serine/threonine phosphatase n=1 Tax=Nocardioides sp. HDW12B TaxID=2714939 RepID=UPI00140AA700|nr:GAF domain-containing SpoIIE family protein phosphatase [Nocardioides sp. HDW12B]QIK67214.1 SpoIIE family protein phosphatase [Nocardioides sp. HDW12B]